MLTPGTSGRAGHELSPAARLCAFVLLAALLFLGAREVGHHLGPVGTSHGRSVVVPSGGSTGGMNMSAGHMSFSRPTGSAR
jgi:hypothetical protein